MAKWGGEVVDGIASVECVKAGFRRKRKGDETPSVRRRRW